MFEIDRKDQCNLNLNFDTQAMPTVNHHPGQHITFFTTLSTRWPLAKTNFNFLLCSFFILFVLLNSVALSHRSHIAAKTSAGFTTINRADYQHVFDPPMNRIGHNQVIEQLSNDTTSVGYHSSFQSAWQVRLPSQVPQQPRNGFLSPGHYLQ